MSQTYRVKHPSHDVWVVFPNLVLFYEWVMHGHIVQADGIPGLTYSSAILREQIPVPSTLGAAERWAVVKRLAA
jgi:hypothetical protein